VEPGGHARRPLAAGVAQRGDDVGEPSAAGAGDVPPVDGDLPGQGGAQRLGAGELADPALAGSALLGFGFMGIGSLAHDPEKLQTFRIRSCAKSKS